ncbi:MAG: rRNA maturation RNase YbeY [SAR202 cluster bacterium]|nr:rRNA maturation RNase YbeY [SAR202 cluster bacterium]
MAPYDIDVQIMEEYEGLLDELWLVRIAALTLDEDCDDPNAAVSIVITGDEDVRALNKEHRGLDENTDVLSFSFEHEGEYYGEDDRSGRDATGFEFVLPPEEKLPIGEVIISYPQTQRQAEQAGHTVGRELSLLITHGILHLLGHDHEEPDEQVVMQAIEKAVMGKVWGVSSK